MDIPKIKGNIQISVLPPGFFTVFKKGMLAEANKVVEEAAKELVEEAKKALRTQKYAKYWDPLSEDYLEHKRRKGLDLRILIATKDYLENGIGIIRKGKKFIVGPLPGKHKDSKLTYRKLARYLEYGTRNMPARPLWRFLKPTFLKKARVIRRMYLAEMRNELKERLKSPKKKRKKIT